MTSPDGVHFFCTLALSIIQYIGVCKMNNIDVVAVVKHVDSVLLKEELINI